jgi:hypothetical protein|tara:strand:+ start:152 stop:946 length:795 start_codon:yes stop_codon:yes gene_type:complete
VSGSKEFVTSNSLVSKVAFLLMVIILFIVLVKIVTTILEQIYLPKDDVVLVDGLKDATKMLIVHQDPSKHGAKPLLRSKNENSGIEFTYSVWILIKDLHYNNGKKKHIFHKGSKNMGSNFNGVSYSDVAFPNNSPGLYIHETDNTLIVYMNTYNNVIEKVEVTDIPLNKWINVAIRVENRNLDVYINGTIVKRHVFTSVPQQNYEDVYVNMNNGFNGLLSSLKYFNRGLTGMEINDIVNSGPNLKMEDMTAFPPYLSINWYFNN